ncbi:hypothetical protein [Pseudomarimonas salicorniae]|uniref:Phosphopantetheine adenylyltransferase n=1 Tax=Pseudomarimonas salicorniae TaxID=2933270 RepID=A0ABT0GIZ4_9GAMM|nr:hypothetical protein [Lysobacter sp. CAU 1642]MCK7594502.1 hypothetical protein [Lysobacter sp. CAU 1642]
MSARHAVAGCLLALTLIHVLPLAGLAGEAALRAGYGLAALDAGSLILLRHRALLFGVLAGLLLASLWRPALRAPVILATLVADGGFLLLAWPWTALPPGLLPILWGDLLAVPLALAALLLGRPASR